MRGHKTLTGPVHLKSGHFEEKILIHTVHFEERI